MKDKDLKRFNSSYLGYVVKATQLKYIFIYGDCENKEEYRAQFDEIEQEVNELVYNSKSRNIDFSEYNDRLERLLNRVNKKKISVNEEKKEDPDPKQTGLMQFLAKNDEIVSDKKELDEKLRRQSNKIHNLRVNMTKMTAIVGLATLLPFVTGAGGAFIGSIVNGSRAFKKTAISYNAKTNKIVGEPEITYDDKTYDYKIIVKVCSPWEKAEFSDGYTREVLEYEYVGKNDDKTVNVDMIIRGIEPIKYAEGKDVLESGDSTDQKEIIVTEITNDIKDFRLTTHAIAPMIVLTVLTGFIGLCVTAYLYDKYDFGDIKAAMEDLHEAKITRKEIKESYEQIGDKIVLLQTESEKDGSEYVELLDMISPDLVKSAEKYRK